MFIRNKFLSHKFIYFLVCYAAYTSVYIARLNLSAAAHGLEIAGILEKETIGIMGSIFFIVFAIGRLVNGFLGDRIKPEKFIGIGLALIGISNILTGLISRPLAMISFWGINAYGQSMLWGAVLRIMVSVYGQEKAKIMTAYVITTTAVGNVLGIIIGTAAQKIGIKYAFYIPGAIALTIAILVIGLIKTVEPVEKKSTENYPLFKLITDARIRHVTIPVMLHGVVKDNINMWAVLYFTDKFKLSSELAATFVFAIPIVGFLGRVVYPFIYNKFGKNEHTVAILAFTVATICSSLMCLSSINIIFAAVLLAVLSATIMIINTSYLSIFPMRFYKENAISSSSGILDLYTYMGAGIGSAVYGVVIKHFGYESMYFSWAVVMAISVIILSLCVIRKNKERACNIRGKIKFKMR